ncbi:MAG TPA: type II secretion system F family protein [Phycisphaerae bacterium]|nr:type II secretion system F family protein [Phycisphaerae bacterium]
MHTYRYQMKKRDGQVVVGTLEADNQTLAAQQIRELGGIVLDLTRTGGHADKTAKSGGFAILNRIGAKDLLAFTSQLSVMSKAGIGVTSALESISDQLVNPRMRTVVATLKRDVEAGRQFSEAVQRFPKVFSVLYVNMVRASELAGTFGHMLSRINDYLTQQAQTRRQVIGAMIYPLIIVILAIMTTVFMLTFILPQFMVLFEGKEEILPLPTKMLMAMSASLRGYWYLYFLVAATAGGSLTYLIRTDAGRAWWDMMKLHIPLVRTLCHALYLSRGLRTMGELVNAGVPMLDTIAITAEVTGNVHYSKVWHRVHAAVRKGQRLAPMLAKSPLIPNSVAQMIAAGEETGTLADILTDISEFYDDQLKATIKAVTSAIEPLMIVVMGGIVAFIAASILLPIFKMSQLVK